MQYGDGLLNSAMGESQWQLSDLASREYEHAGLLNTTLHRKAGAGVLPQTTTSDIMVWFLRSMFGEIQDSNN